MADCEGGKGRGAIFFLFCFSKNMNIVDKLGAGLQNTIPEGKVQDAITTSLLSRGLEDVFEAQKPLTKLQKKILQFADEVWRDMKMPENRLRLLATALTNSERKS